MENNRFSKIISNPEILGGKPCISGTRISVDIILEWIASGASIADIVKQYPYIEEIAVVQAIQYAAMFIKNEIFIEVKRAA